MRRRTLAVVALVLVALASACGQEETEVPSVPDVSRAQPTGTVNTTVPTAN